MLCLKLALQLEEGLLFHCDLMQPQPGLVIQEGPWEGVGIERMRDYPPLPAALSQPSATHAVYHRSTPCGHRVAFSAETKSCLASGNSFSCSSVTFLSQQQGSPAISLRQGFSNPF